MESDLLKLRLTNLLPESVLTENRQFPEVIVPAVDLHAFCENLKTSPDLLFDYLISLTAVDWTDHFMMVYHITSVKFRHTVVVKCRINNRVNPEVETLSDIW